MTMLSTIINVRMKNIGNLKFEAIRDSGDTNPIPISRNAANTKKTEIKIHVTLKNLRKTLVLKKIVGVKKETISREEARK